MYLLLFSLRPSSILPRTMLPFTSYLTFTFFSPKFLNSAVFGELKIPATFKPRASYEMGSKVALKNV